jgi:N-formylglutamate deformylase
MKNAIIHIPHSSKEIPLNIREQFILNDKYLNLELIKMTDYKTDEIFNIAGCSIISSEISRLVVDVERFPNDENEPMSKKGMGVIYYKTHDQKKLRRQLANNEKSELLSKYYFPHHNKLNESVRAKLEKYGKVLIIDCHSFSSLKLSYEMGNDDIRPDICIGSDSFHTSSDILEFTVKTFKDEGFSVKENYPFEGTLVPSDFYLKDKRVTSIMIELNRGLYMNEKSGRVNNEYERIKKIVQNCCILIIEKFA